MAWALLRDDGHRIVAADLPGHGCWTHFFCLHGLQTNHQQRFVSCRCDRHAAWFVAVIFWQISKHAMLASLFAVEERGALQV